MANTPKADNEAGSNGGARRPRHRSPYYPSFGLEEAITRTEQIWNAMHDHFVPTQSIAEMWNTTLRSSVFQQALGTLVRFGLLEDRGKGESRQVRVTDLAQDILIRENDSPERSEAIRKAALTPAIHQELWDRFSGNLPNSDSPIRVYLLREREGATFNKDHVDKLIGQFRATLAFACLTDSDKIVPAGEKDEDAPSSAPAWSKPPMQSQSSKKPLHPAQADNASAVIKMRDLPVTLPSNLEVAVFRVPVPMTETDFKTLVSSLNAMKDVLVATAKP